MKTKTGAVLLGLLFAVGIGIQPVIAARKSMIRKFTGTIQITKPNGKIIIVTDKDKLPKIPSGSTIRIIDGNIDVKPYKGFVTVILGNTAVKVGKLGRVVAAYDRKTKTADFKYGGEVSIIKGNTTINIKKGQRAQILMNKKTGVITIKSLRGNIETITGGVTVIVPEDAIAKLSFDKKTNNVTVESGAGELEIISDKGEVTVVAEGTTVEVGSSGELAGKEAEKPGKPGKEEPEVEITDEELIDITEPEIEDEPAEPEFPEASVFLP